MDTQRISKIILWLLFLIIFCIINEWAEWLKEKKKRNILVSMLISAITYVLVTVVSSPVVEPLDSAVKELKESGEEQLAIIIEKIPIDSNMSEQDVEEGEKEALDQNVEGNSRSYEQLDSDKVVSVSNEENQIKYHPNIPVANRVLVPTWSLYPDVTMEAVSLLASRGGRNYGYQGATRAGSSVTYAFTAPSLDAEGLFWELEEEILKNPFVGEMIVRGLQKEYSDFEKEPMMKEFAEKCRAAFELPRDTQERGIGIWYAGYRFPDDKTEIYVTDDYRRYAEALCQVLEKFTNFGVQNFKSRAYYESNMGVTYEDAQTQEVEANINPQALVLYRTNNQGEVVCVIGFDLNDKGLLIYDTDVIN